MSAGQLLNTFEDIKAYLDSLVKGEYLLKSETNFNSSPGSSHLLTAAQRSKLIDLPVITQAQVDQFVEAYDRGDWNAAIVTTLDVEDDSKLASAGTVFRLHGMIESINALIASDDTNLDELQEIVDFIKNNKTDLESLGIDNIAGLQAALDGKVDEVTGKGLSTNDLTNDLVNKINTLYESTITNGDFARLDGSNMPFTNDFSITSGNLSVSNGPAGAAIFTISNYVGSGRIRLNGADQLELFNEINDDLLFGTSDVERARITAGGNFLVNSTVDSGEQFKVIGTSKLQGAVDVTGEATFRAPLTKFYGTGAQSDRRLTINETTTGLAQLYNYDEGDAGFHDIEIGGSSSSGTGVTFKSDGSIATPAGNQIPEYQFGNLVMGTGTDNGWAFIRHRSQPDNFANYGITLAAQGDTKINAVSGRNLYLDIGNASKMVLTSTLFTSSVPVSISQAGSAASPALSFDGGDTGLFVYSTDRLSIAAGGNEVARFNGANPLDMSMDLYGGLRLGPTAQEYTLSSLTNNFFDSNNGTLYIRNQVVGQPIRIDVDGSTRRLDINANGIYATGNLIVGNSTNLDYISIDHPGSSQTKYLEFKNGSNGLHSFRAQYSVNGNFLLRDDLNAKTVWEVNPDATFKIHQPTQVSSDLEVTGGLSAGDTTIVNELNLKQQPDNTNPVFAFKTTNDSVIGSIAYQEGGDALFTGEDLTNFIFQDANVWVEEQLHFGTSVPYYQFYKSGDDFIFSETTGGEIFKHDNSAGLVDFSANLKVQGTTELRNTTIRNITPFINAAYTIGSPSMRFDTVYATGLNLTGNINASGYNNTAWDVAYDNHLQNATFNSGVLEISTPSDTYTFDLDARYLQGTTTLQDAVVAGPTVTAIDADSTFQILRNFDNAALGLLMTDTTGANTFVHNTNDGSTQTWGYWRQWNGASYWDVIVNTSGKLDIKQGADVRLTLSSGEADFATDVWGQTLRVTATTNTTDAFYLGEKANNPRIRYKSNGFEFVDSANTWETISASELILKLGGLSIPSLQKLYWGSESESYIIGNATSGNIKIGTNGSNRVEINNVNSIFYTENLIYWNDNFDKGLMFRNSGRVNGQILQQNAGLKITAGFGVQSEVANITDTNFVVSSDTPNGMTFKVGRQFGLTNGLEVTTSGGDSILRSVGGAAVNGTMRFHRDNGTGNDVETARFDADGNFALGVDNANGHRMRVFGTTSLEGTAYFTQGAQASSYLTVNGSFNINSSGANTQISGDASSNIYWANDGEIRLRPSGFTSNRVVFGTTNAIHGDTTITGDLTVHSNDFMTSSVQDFYFSNLEDDGAFVFRLKDAGGTNRNVMFLDYAGSQITSDLTLSQDLIMTDSQGISLGNVAGRYRLQNDGNRIIALNAGNALSRVQGGDAVDADEFVTKSQLDAVTGSQNLQQVTDEGSVTTNEITVDTLNLNEGGVTAQLRAHQLNLNANGTISNSQVVFNDQNGTTYWLGTGIKTNGSFSISSGANATELIRLNGAETQFFNELLVNVPNGPSNTSRFAGRVRIGSTANSDFALTVDSLGSGALQANGDVEVTDHLSVGGVDSGRGRIMNIQTDTTIDDGISTEWNGGSLRLFVTNDNRRNISAGGTVAIDFDAVDIDMNLPTTFAADATFNGNATVVGTISAAGGNSNNWNTAYGWGDHATAGYLTSADLGSYATQSWVASNHAGIGGNLTQNFSVNVLKLQNSETGDLASAGQIAYDTNDIGAPASLGGYNSTHPIGLYVHDGTDVRRIWTTDHFNGTHVANWQTAYGWGDHANLYLPLSGGSVSGNLSMGTAGFGGTANRRLNIQSDSDNVAIALAENSGGEAFALGVDANGSFVLQNSSVGAVHTTFHDDGRTLFNGPLTINNGTTNIGLTISSTDDTAGLTLMDNDTEVDLMAAGSMARLQVNNVRKLDVATDGARFYGDSSNSTFTSRGQVAIKRANNNPYLSFHANDGTRLGYIQTVGSSYLRLQSDGGYIDLNDNVVINGTLNTGQGATEVHLMNQNVRTSDSVTFANAAWSGNQSGNPRAVGIGYSGGNYGGISYGVSYTGTSGLHQYAINDIVTRVDLHNGLVVYAAPGGSVGSNITWEEVLEVQRDAFQYKGLNVLHAGNYTSYFSTPSLQAVTNEGSTTTQSITAASFTGGGANLTGLNASHLATGTVPSSRISGNYAVKSTATSGQLHRKDDRTIEPNSISSGSLQFGFTSYNNNNTGPWADFLHMRSYTDASGGADNLVMFSKSGIGMRIWQQSYGSASRYSSYADVLLSSNFGSWVTKTFVDSLGINATSLGGTSASSVLRALGSSSSSNINNLTDNGYRVISYSGSSSAMLSFNTGGSTGTVQQEYLYNTPVRGYRIRNKTDNTNWSAWGYVAMTTANQGHINGTLWHSGNDGAGSGLRADVLESGNISNLNTAWQDQGTSEDNGLQIFRYSASASNKPISSNNANWVMNIYSHGGSSGNYPYGHQIAAADTEDIYFRRVQNGGFHTWRKLFHTGNYTSYVVPKSGGTFTGAITANNFIKASDSRLKDGQDGSVLSLATLRKIEPQLYKMKASGEVQAGVYADQLPEEVAFMTEPIDGGYVGMKYDNLHALSIAAIQEVDDENRALRKEVNALRNEVEELKMMIQKLI